jgi:hypothetical protein
MRLLLLVTCLAILFAVTNPKRDDHVEALRQKAIHECGGGWASILCGGVAGLAGAGMEYESYVLFSTGRLGDVKSIGVLTKVFVDIGDKPTQSARPQGR